MTSPSCTLFSNESTLAQGFRPRCCCCLVENQISWLFVIITTVYKKICYETSYLQKRIYRYTVAFAFVFTLE